MSKIKSALYFPSHIFFCSVLSISGISSVWFHHLFIWSESENWESSLPFLFSVSLCPIHQQVQYILPTICCSQIHSLPSIPIALSITSSLANYCRSPFICLLIFSLVYWQGMIFPKVKLDYHSSAYNFCLLCDLIFRYKLFKIKKRVL